MAASGLKLHKFLVLFIDNGRQPLKHVGAKIICGCTISFVCSISWVFNNKEYKKMPGMNTVKRRRPFLILYIPCTMFYINLLFTT
jgi:hypothetical protein